MTITTNGINALLNEACVRLGYCLSYDDRVRLTAVAVESSLSPAVLAKEILVAEGLNPDSDLRQFKEVRVFCEEFYANNF